jgi:hypothetical protein
MEGPEAMPAPHLGELNRDKAAVSITSDIELCRHTALY